MEIKNLSIDSHDVPVLLLGYKRPDFLRQRIKELSSMPLRHIYISIDGGVGSYSPEMRGTLDWAKSVFVNERNLKIIEHRENLGLVHHCTSSISYVLNHHPYILVVEDDIKLSSNFFLNMLAGLSLQKDLKKRGIVGGFSSLNLYKNPFLTNRWRSSKYISMWGWGCSKEIWHDYQLVIKKEEINEKLAISKTWSKLSIFQKQVWLGRFNKVATNPNYTYDIQFQFLSFVKDYENFYPISTLVINEGYSDLRSTNNTGHKPRWLSTRPPNIEIMGYNFATPLTRKLLNLIDSNLLFCDSRAIHLYKHKFKF